MFFITPKWICIIYLYEKTMSDLNLKGVQNIWVNSQNLHPIKQQVDLALTTFKKALNVVELW